MNAPTCVDLATILQAIQAQSIEVNTPSLFAYAAMVGWTGVLSAQRAQYGVAGFWMKSSMLKSWNGLASGSTSMNE